MDETKTSLHDKLVKIQTELVAKKDLYNKFGKYNYRSAESIIESLKPHLKKHGLSLTIKDDVKMIGNRFYIMATVELSDGKETIQTTAFAREEEEKKGMDASQVTGASSSYARKYALNGMFAIDDTKDADELNNNAEYTEPRIPQEIIDTRDIAKNDLTLAQSIDAVK